MWIVVDDVDVDVDVDDDDDDDVDDDDGDDDDDDDDHDDDDDDVVVVVRKIVHSMGQLIRFVHLCRKKKTCTISMPFDSIITEMNYGSLQRLCVQVGSLLSMNHDTWRLLFIHGCFLKWWYPQNTPK